QAVYLYDNVGHVSSTGNPSLSLLNHANSFTPILLRTLCRSCKRQVLWNQANPRSLRKIPGVGVPRLLSHSDLPAKSFIYRFYAEAPRNSFIYRIYAVRPGVWGTLGIFLGAHAARGGAVPLTTFRINTCKSVTKQTTLTLF